MKNTYELLKKQQQSWASAEHIDFNDNGYVKELRCNLFQKPSENTVAEFTAGKGREMDNHMLALHSSSALVVNFFEWWKTSDNIPKLGKAIGLTKTAINLTFEKTHNKPTGIPGIKPHLDLELGGSSFRAAIESKYTEPYQRKRKTLKPAYAQENIWGNLIGCERLANAIVDGKEVFQYLDAPQLLKHIMGLKTDYGERGFELVYQWFNYPSEESDNHAREIKTFGKYVDNEVNTRYLSYQELFKVIQTIPEAGAGYIGYLKKRYFQNT
jgi:hypothetical protein